MTACFSVLLTMHTYSWSLVITPVRQARLGQSVCRSAALVVVSGLQVIAGSLMHVEIEGELL